MHGSLFSAFLLITAVLYVTPGPVVTLVVTTAARDGVRAGLMTVGGGVVGHAALLACIAFGLSWILWASAEVFDYLRWVGAAYLVWLGVQAWRHAGTWTMLRHRAGMYMSGEASSSPSLTRKPSRSSLRFLPQFIDPTLPIQRQLLVMCVTAEFSIRVGRSPRAMGVCSLSRLGTTACSGASQASC
jgi:homoserine/homoserine lactone efflux protein